MININPTPSPIPWKIAPDGYGNMHILSTNDGDDELIIRVDTYVLPDLIHMINCVNEHDDLIAKVELLKHHLLKIIGFCNKHGKNHSTCRIYGSDDLTDIINEADTVLNCLSEYNESEN